MQEWGNAALESLFFSAKWFAIVMVLFTLLARLWPSLRTQPLFHRGMLPDVFYWFAGPLLYGKVYQLFLAFLATSVTIRSLNFWGNQHFSTLPVLVQAFLILLIGDFFQYWLHRFFHRDPLWKYHAIHHSPQVVDWLTSARFHPINIILYSTSINALVATLGFSFEAFAILVPFNMIYSPLVHANVPWTYGPFKYVLASPVFHRWHHTHLHEGGNKNFAPTFAFLDVLFGTFYMPKGKQPEIFGIEGNPVPETVLGQLAYPFKPQTEQGNHLTNIKS